jgi:basic membrane protein A and related proteins
MKSRAVLGSNIRVAVVVCVAGVAMVGCSSNGSSGSTLDAGKGCGAAFVFADPIAPSAYEQQIDAGVQEAAKRLDITIKTVESQTIDDIAVNLRAYAQAGCYSLIATGGPTAPVGLAQVAKQFPKQQFAIVDSMVPAPNVTSYEFASEQGTYVIGALAAMMTKTNVIGETFGLNLPPLKRYSAGFLAGAKSVNPHIRVLTEFAGSFDDPALSLAAAVSEHAAGADLIFTQTGSDFTAQRESCAKGYRVVGGYPPEAAEAKSPCVTSLFGDNLTQATFLMFKGSLDHTVEPGTAHELTLADGAFTIAPINQQESPYDSIVPPNIISRVKAIYHEIATGEIKIKDPLT